MIETILSIGFQKSASNTLWKNLWQYDNLWQSQIMLKIKEIGDLESNKTCHRWMGVESTDIYSRL